MRVSLQWLRQLVPFDLDPEALAERLSIAGFEVEAMENLAHLARGVVVGLVESCERHPNADKLSVCKVSIGELKPLQIVCGAANVCSGIHVPVALEGSHLPAAGLTIKSSELRGVLSQGMICSLSELGQSDGSSGIAVLDEHLSVPLRPGEPVAPLLGLDDVVMELAVTANRPDGLSMLGIAREVAALSGKGLTPPPTAELPTPQLLPASNGSATRMDEGGLYSLTELIGLRVAPSPPWLCQALQRAGLRPINNVVDVTNFVLLEQGQPLHAFDRECLGRLTGGTADPEEIGLRAGRPGERFSALGGQSLELDERSLVVTYADQAVALAGIIGGFETAVNKGSSAIWLESAVFDAASVRLSSRQAGIRTESSTRFEKGLPVEVCETACARAVALLDELCSATVTRRWVHRRAVLPQVPLLLRKQAIHQLLGPVLREGSECLLDEAAVEATLSALGCSLETCSEGWHVLVPPSRRTDLQREVDLIEEVARLVGFDHFSSRLPAPLLPGRLTPPEQAERRLRRALAQAGLQETTSSSLISGTSQADAARVAIANPLLAEASHLRDGLQDALLAAAVRNLQARQPGFWAFEIGHVFPPTEAKAADDPCQRQRARLSGVICGERRMELWRSHGKSAAPDYYQARGLLGRALSSLGLAIADHPFSSHRMLHPGRAAELFLEGRALGWFGELHPRRALEDSLPGATYLFDLDLERLLTAVTRTNRWHPRFVDFATVPSSDRDLALLVPKQVTSAQIANAIQKAGRPLLERVDLVDRFESDQLGEGVCSQAFRLRFRDPKRTLTDADVTSVLGRILVDLAQRFSARIRG